MHYSQGVENLNSPIILKGQYNNVEAVKLLLFYNL